MLKYALTLGKWHHSLSEILIMISLRALQIKKKKNAHFIFTLCLPNSVHSFIFFIPSLTLCKAVCATSHW